MDVYQQFASDETKESQGVWCPQGGEASLLVARSGNRAYARMLSREVEKHQRTLDLKNDAADEMSDKIMIDVMAETILLGWKGIQFKGADLPYSKANAKMLLGVKDFRVHVSKLAGDFEAFRAVQETVAAGN
jgi:hypothetical protein